MLINERLLSVFCKIYLFFVLSMLINLLVQLEEWMELKENHTSDGESAPCLQMG